MINFQLAKSFHVSVDQVFLAVQTNNYFNSPKILIAMSFDVKVEQVLCLINVQLARSFVVIVDQVSLAVQINN